MLSDAETKNLLNRRFDLIILDGAFPECALGLVHAFRVPFMYINTVGFYMGSLQMAGNPAPYATTPIFFSSFTDEMNLYQRFLNTMYTMFAYSVHRVSVQLGIDFTFRHLKNWKRQQRKITFNWIGLRDLFFFSNFSFHVRKHLYVCVCVWGGDVRNGNNMNCVNVISRYSTMIIISNAFSSREPRQNDTHKIVVLSINCAKFEFEKKKEKKKKE